MLLHNSTPGGKLTSDMVWMEKYRPTSLDAVEFEGVDKLKRLLELPRSEFPNILLYGSAGTGKTTIARIIRTELACECLSINGSDETSVENIRERVKPFVKSKSLSAFRLVLIEEADYLSKNSQTALRALMDECTRNARFVFTLNYVEKIINPLLSRCVTFRVANPRRAAILEILSGIAESEGLTVEDGVLDRVVNETYPDVRAAINTLQELSVKNPIRVEDVNPHHQALDIIYANLLGDVNYGFYAARKMWIDRGIESEELLHDWADRIAADSVIANDTKLKVLEILGDASWQIGISVDKELAISGAASRMRAVVKNRV